MSRERRRRADRILAIKARLIARSQEYSRKTRRRAFAVWLLFSFRVRVGWHRKPSRHLAFAWHGNHCGPNHGLAGAAPVDDLDAACLEHDESY